MRKWIWFALVHVTKETGKTPDYEFELNITFELCLKGKFSSGIEGALASTLNRDFNWKQLSEIILCFLGGCFQSLFE